jgi:hypothetical protein
MQVVVNLSSQVWPTAAHQTKILARVGAIRAIDEWHVDVGSFLESVTKVPPLRQFPQRMKTVAVSNSVQSGIKSTATPRGVCTKVWIAA